MKMKKTRTLKMRIYRMISVFNFGSLAVTMIALILALGVVMSFISQMISNSAANQMSLQLRMEDNRTANYKTGKTQFKTLNPNDQSIYKNLDITFRMTRSTLMKKEATTGEGIDFDSTPMKAEKQFLPFLNDLSLVDYSVYRNGKLQFESKTHVLPNHKIINAVRHSSLFQSLNHQTIVNVKNDSGKVIARLIVGMNPDLIFIGYFSILLLCLMIFIICYSLSRVVAIMISRIIIKPVNELDHVMKKLAGGELEQVMNTEIRFKRPVKEIESLARSSNIIISKMHDFVSTLANQKLELEAQNNDLLDKSSALETVNENLENKNIKLKNILDNVDQGFVMFKQDLRIHSEYSLVCEKIFSGCISDKTLVEILYPENQNMQHFIEELLKKLFESDKKARGIYLPLMPEELTINGRIVHIAYKFVMDEKEEESIMVIITDITDKRTLEKLMDEERNVLKMVVKSIIDRDEFLELVKEFEEFWAGLKDEAINNSFDHEHLLRQIHTFKGNFSQYDMVNIVPELNELEDRLYENQTDFTLFDVNRVKLDDVLKKDIDIIVSYAGRDFTREGEYCYIKKEKLIEIEKKIQATLTVQECNVILPLIKNLRYKSVKELLKTYPGYVMKLSERLGKSIHPIEITGDEIMVDANYYTKVVKALSHIFRNGIDHGIETEDERVEANKDMIGNISCNVKDLGDAFEIHIADDGRGIDLEILKEKVLEEGLYNEDEWQHMTDGQKYELILEQGITTIEEASYISGRGVGMSAVREAVQESGGTIKVISEKGVGTHFILKLPKIEEQNGVDITSDEFITELAKTTESILLSHTGGQYHISEIQHKNTINLNNITALISLSGTLNAIIMISANKKMAENLVRHFIIDQLSDEEVQHYLEDIVGEVTNTIMGNVFGSFENRRGVFHIGLPAVLSNNEAYIKYTQSQIIAVSLINGEYELNINILMVNEDGDFGGLSNEV